MTRLYEILISMAIVAVLFLLVGIFLPSSRHLVEKVETNRNRTIVFDTINSFHRFKDWNPVALRDPAIKLQVSGPEAGVGARMDYDSEAKGIGKGSWEIVESDQDERVLYRLENTQRGDNKRMEFALKTSGRAGRNIEITQRYNVDYGWDLIGRYAGMYVRSTVGDDMKIGINKLGSMLAAVPNTDYRVEGSKLRDLSTSTRPAENLLTVFAGAVERNNLKIQDSMKANSEWIKRTMESNDLEPAGPMRIISTELGRENYTFDVVQPVRKKRASSGDGEGAEVAAVDDGELADLELLGPVTYERTPPTRVAHAKYTGYMAELENVRNAVRAWAMTHGHEAVGRPYEFYVNGIDDAFTADGEFEVYWTLKD